MCQLPNVEAGYCALFEVDESLHEALTNEIADGQTNLESAVRRMLASFAAADHRGG